MARARGMRRRADAHPRAKAVVQIAKSRDGGRGERVVDRVEVIEAQVIIGRHAQRAIREPARSDREEPEDGFRETEVSDARSDRCSQAQNREDERRDPDVPAHVEEQAPKLEIDKEEDESEPQIRHDKTAVRRASDDAPEGAPTSREHDRDAKPRENDRRGRHDHMSQSVSQPRITFGPPQANYFMPSGLPPALSAVNEHAGAASAGSARARPQRADRR